MSSAKVSVTLLPSFADFGKRSSLTPSNGLQVNIPPSPANNAGSTTPAVYVVLNMGNQ